MNDLLKDKSIKTALNKLNLDQIIRMRNNMIKGSPMYEALNIIKAIKLESINSKFNEKLRVIRDDLVLFENFRPYNANMHYLLESKSVILRRSVAEYQNEYRQLVCNAIVRQGDNYILLARNNSKKDNRLQGLAGLPGGHVNDCDTSLINGGIREVQEELHYIDINNCQIKPLGYIRMTASGDSKPENEISREHLCVLYVIDVDHNVNHIKSTSLGETLVWKTKDQIKSMIANKHDAKQALVLDSWAEIAFRELFKLENDPIQD